MNRAVEETVAYVKSRQAFGHSLFEFQNTAFELAECQTIARTVRGVPRSLHPGAPARRTRRGRAAMAKYWLTDKQCEVVDRCVQLHGGYGYMRE
ncbi:acyl-CoA dehydrogenase, partial [Rhodococcus hoagii]|nr:acyl-CoA dehydrogenase [Prescottella equi]